MATFNFIPDLPKNKSNIIKVIGVGGGGGNAVNYMFKEGIVGVDFYVCNTDAQALDISPIPNKIHLGATLTEGLGAGSDPEVGRKCALESTDRVSEVMRQNTKMVFITAGMGGGTGTGAAPVIAKIAKEMGLLTVGIITTPFEDEGPERRKQAQLGIDNLRPHVDALLTISNDRIIDMYGDLRISEAFAMADSILCTAAKGIAEIITIAGQVNVDFKDVKTAMTESGKAIMGTGLAKGPNRALEAAQMALDSPLLDDTSIKGATHILLNITYGSEEPFMREQKVITQFFQEEAGLGAKLKFGLCHNPKLGEELAVTIIATGFDNKRVPEEKQNIEIEFEIESEGEITPVSPTGQIQMALQQRQYQSELQREQKLLERENLLRNGNKQNENDLNAPAYLRNGVMLENTPDSSDTLVSRTFLVDEKDDESPILGDNGYIHNKPD